MSEAKLNAKGILGVTELDPQLEKNIDKMDAEFAGSGVKPNQIWAAQTAVLIHKLFSW